MPPKATPSVSPETVAQIELFKSIGLTQAKAAEAAKSPKSAGILTELIEKHNLVNKGLEEKQTGLVAALAVQGGKVGEAERGYVLDAVLDGRLKSVDQVNGEHFCHFCHRRVPRCTLFLERHMFVV